MQRPVWKCWMLQLRGSLEHLLVVATIISAYNNLNWVQTCDSAHAKPDTCLYMKFCTILFIFRPGERTHVCELVRVFCYSDNIIDNKKHSLNHVYTNPNTPYCEISSYL
ncbi:hypothetical protein GDO86_013895 [Hymenochirus boettgeri]|uniref:Uncharacterized protein n=1 Tax=Hymenochirus boettgeri TaxID=247094 RepID=A0A8T2JRL5_9PIPI|nr:hypothetical protein GDO86_013895 [Hymenochirus boettgeri]